MERELDKAFSYSITRKDSDQRIDTFLASQVPELTRSRVQALTKKGFVRVNGRQTKASYRLRDGDQVSLSIPPVRPYHLEPEPVPFGVIHEDASLIVLNKPPGVVIHPSPGHPTGTLVHGLLEHCRDLSGIGGVLRPGIVHRLDKDTSGLMVVAKSDPVHEGLARQFKAGSVKKRYLAVVHGITREAEGKIDGPVGRHPKRRKEMSVVPIKGKSAVTFWERMAVFESGFTLLSVIPKTGRTHQIRVHLSHGGHPVVADPVYGYGRKWWKKSFPRTHGLLPHVKRQMLHAETLGFMHPDSGRYSEFRAPLPDDMSDLLDALKRIDLLDKMD